MGNDGNGDPIYATTQSQFAVSTTQLPDATPGSPYGPVTLQAVNVGASTSPNVTRLSWKKVTMPRGLYLSSAGLLAGTPSKKLIAGSSSITVQVTETVTTLSGHRKVNTRTTAQAVIPLTVA